MVSIGLMIVVDFGNFQDYLEFFWIYIFAKCVEKSLCNFESDVGDFGTIMKVFDRDTSL